MKEGKRVRTTMKPLREPIAIATTNARMTLTPIGSPK